MKQIKCFIAIIIVLGVILSGCLEEQPKQQQPVKTIEGLAIDIVSLLMKNNFSGVYSFFDSSISSQITAEEFAGIWEQQVIPSHGTILGIVKTRVSNESVYSVVYVTCNFSEVDTLDVKILFNSERKVVSLLVVPAQEEFQYTPPSYVDLSLFTEEEVVIGSGKWMLPGTLTIPNGKGPFPAVVLVHGSGPNDRDETYGPNKPFKDIAWGLASQGIVVLRYEKRTKEYPNESAAIDNFTVEDETIDDALAGVDLLNNSVDVNHSDIFVLGHSLGGMLAPQIALQDDRIAGLIILAGPTRPLEDLLLEQTQYLANLSGINQSNEIASIKDMVEKIKNLDINESELVLGASKSYWVYLSIYDPVVTAQSLLIPMLILQGKRDYQVTMIDFARWNDTFSRRSSVKLLNYQFLNHFFIAGTGVPNNSEYLIEGHVAEEVILDISNWIKNI